MIFDIDGTLINSNNIDSDCFISAFELEFGFTNISSSWAKYTNVTDSGIAQEIFIEKLGQLPTQMELENVKKCFVNLLQKSSHENPNLFDEILGSGQILAELQVNQDWCVAIATGGWYNSAILKLEKANLNIQGIPLASSDDGITREDIINCAISKSKEIYQVREFQKIVFVGDGVWDVATAYNLNIAFIGRENKLDNILLNAGVENIVEDFIDSTNFLKLLKIAKIPE
ncbi:HAD family hydrolase [Anabaena sp. CCY 9910]|uniref:HAD family hydrolase n=1 Tax=Anabaena sp. CCY 9910 TaxID=3103870 RepID=UPI0039DF3767